MPTIKENLETIHNRIKRRCEKVDRDPATVTLVAVTKYVGVDEIKRLHDCGCRHFGESRPQVLWEKAELLQQLDIKWHMIGQLQRNKARKTLPICDVIHSGESTKLIRHLDRISNELEINRDVMLEVNISEDDSKHGFSPEALKQLVDEQPQFFSSLENVRITGLMSMASRVGGELQAAKDFAKFSEFHKELVMHLQASPQQNIELNQLSIGMSGDFEVAIEHGATLVRVGSALFL